MDSEQKSFSCPYIFPYRKHIIKEITVIFNESTLHKKNYTGILLKNIEGLVMLLDIGGNEHFRLVDLIKYQIFVTPEEEGHKTGKTIPSCVSTNPPRVLLRYSLSSIPSPYFSLVFFYSSLKI